jgi:hypothetical protein
LSDTVQIEPITSGDYGYHNGYQIKQVKTLAAERTDDKNRLLKSSKLLAFVAKNPERLHPEQLNQVRQPVATLRKSPASATKKVPSPHKSPSHRMPA